MKLYVYAAEPDEIPYFDAFSAKYGIEYDYTEEYPSPENLSWCKGYDAISIITNLMGKDELDRLYSYGIKYLITRSIGYEHINVRYAHQLGMRTAHVTYSPNAVANYTIMMMLIACRKLPFIMRKNARQDFTLPGNLGKELSLSTVGVIGTGNIGSAVVRHLSGFGCKILMSDPYPKEELKQYGEYTDIETLYQNADIITLHVPASADTHHMISDAELVKMKDGVILVNAARGSLIDTEAMIRALENGKIGFAALDTIENEEGLYYLDHSGDILKNHDRSILMAFPNVFLSPHMAYYTEEAVSDRVYHVFQLLKDFAEGQENPLEVK